MLGEPDKQGRYKLSGKEYSALLRIMATHNEMIVSSDAIKERIKTIKYGWRDFCRAKQILDKLSRDLLDTVPLQKLLVIQREVKAARLYIKIGPDACPDPNDHVVYINETAFVALLDQIVAMNCLLCDKHGREVKKCPWLKLIEDVMPYSPDPELDPSDGSCQIAGRASIIEES